MTDGGARRATAHYSATMLTGCLRQTRLMMETPYYVDLDRAFPAFRGQWGHLVTEHNAVPGTIYEIRWELPFELADGRRVIFTGQGDALDLVLNAYRDFKTKTQSRNERQRNGTSKRVYKPLPTDVGEDYVFQLNAYQMLFYLGSPQRPIETDAFGDVLPGGVRFYPGVPAQIELDWAELFMWNMDEVKRYPCVQIDYHRMYDEVLRRLELLLMPGLPPVPQNMNPVDGVFCRDWCPAEIRAACLAGLAGAIAF